MKRFSFRLQPLLKYRQYLERIAQQNAAKANMDVANCQNQISQLENIHQAQAIKMETMVFNGISAAEFRQHQQYLESVDSRIQEEQLRKIQLARILTEKLLELKKKSIDKKAMEIYRERLKSAYGQRMIKIEQKELDEISSLKTARKASNETHP